MNRAVAIFDYQVKRTNPIGSCHLQLMERLCHTIDFSVFAVEFENPEPSRIRWIRIPAPRRPLALLFVTYHLLAPIYYLVHRLRTGCRFDLVQIVESKLLFGSVSYAHFCHRAYLRHHWEAAGFHGVRKLLRWLDHRLHAVLEPLVFRLVRKVVVPSRGLARELASEYQHVASKLTLLPNPVDLRRFSRPVGFDAVPVRREMGVSTGQTAFLFVALGHFERKGFALLVDAVRALGRPDVKIVIAGGNEQALVALRERVSVAGVADSFTFLGMRDDVRPLLWAADALLFPTSYEVFSLATLEAAAAGLPLLATRVNGIEEFLEDGRNGIELTRTVAGVMEGMERFLRMSPSDRQRMAGAARADVQQYSVEHFAGLWRNFYECQVDSQTDRV